MTDRGHVETDVEYPTVPPVGGDHAPIWQDCAAYATPVLDELAVHSLEHGAVWLAYNPALPEPDRAALAVRAGGYVLVSPVEEAVAPVVAVAWGLRLELEGVDDPRLEAFVTSYAEGPQTLEPGAPCSGGYSERA